MVADYGQSSQGHICHETLQFASGAISNIVHLPLPNSWTASEGRDMKTYLGYLIPDLFAIITASM